MMSPIRSSRALLLMLLSHCLSPSLAAPAPKASSSKHSDSTKGFTYDNTTFLLNGSPFQIIGGQMDPQRVPSEYWRSRLSMARAMGLNTIFSYIYWNKIEPEQGTFDFSGNNDLATYVRTAQEEGLKVVLRPGPYICGERDWGGFPYWLSQIEAMVIRSNNTQFLSATDTFLGKVAEQLAPLQASKGGPILMVQVENEYGFYGSGTAADTAYLTSLAGLLRKYYDVPLYTNDKGTVLPNGVVHGVLAETDADPKQGYAARQKLTDSTEMGPFLEGEYYVSWIDEWRSTYKHQQFSGNSTATDKVLDDLDWVLSNGHSFSIYMFHGGTNFGFDNGAYYDPSTGLLPVTTSYDYGAPLDESGRVTEIYGQLRDMISKHVPKDSIPDVPSRPAMATISETTLKPVAEMFPTVRDKPLSNQQTHPISMDALGQDYGFTLYEHIADKSYEGDVSPGDKGRDRAIVYVNGERQGVINVMYKPAGTVSVKLSSGDILQILVENLGRVDVDHAMDDQIKGIVGDIKVGDDTLEGWTMSSYSYHKHPGLFHSLSSSTVDEKRTPIYYKGNFSLSCTSAQKSDASARDTFLSLKNGLKGVVWVNGFKLGKYWSIGPQQQLYIPGMLLEACDNVNEVVVLELEPSESTMTMEGLDKRTWGNGDDPDNTS